MGATPDEASRTAQLSKISATIVSGTLSRSSDVALRRAVPTLPSIARAVGWVATELCRGGSARAPAMARAQPV